MADDEAAERRTPTWRRGGLLAALAVLAAAGVGIGVSTVAAGDGPPKVAPSPPAGSSPAAAVPSGAVPSGAPTVFAAPRPPARGLATTPATTPATAPGPAGGSAAASGPPTIVTATAADLQWTRSAGFLTCSGLVINVRATTTGDVTKVLAYLLRVSGGPTTTLKLSGSKGTWSASSLELNAPSEWRVRVVAIGPQGRDVQLARITAPDGSGTTLRHVCTD